MHSLMLTIRFRLSKKVRGGGLGGGVCVLHTALHISSHIMVYGNIQFSHPFNGKKYTEVGANDRFFYRAQPTSLHPANFLGL
jgi:hypothetical protein